MALFERMWDMCSELHFPSVREWKRAHPDGRAIAYFPVYTPVELIHAAGMFPVGLAGAGDRLDIQHADARFGSFICSIVKTTLEMALTGHLEPFDGFLFSSICDSARNLCFVLKRNFPGMYVDFLHLPHNPSSPAATQFLVEEYRRILAELERLGNCRVRDDTLHRSIALYNHNRALIRELYDLRTRNPEQVPTWQLYQLIRAGNFMPVEEHTAQLQEALVQFRAGGTKQRDSIRIVVEGSFCEQPPLPLIRLIEDAGCYIVDDDFVIGQSWFDSDVPREGDPLWALATSYMDHAVCSSVRHDFRKPRWEELVAKVRRSQADAVLFLVAKFCEPAYFDYVPYRQELERAGIPHLQLEFEEKSFTFDRLRMEVETFVESLVFD